MKIRPIQSKIQGYQDRSYAGHTRRAGLLCKKLISSTIMVFSSSRRRDLPEGQGSIHGISKERGVTTMKTLQNAIKHVISPEVQYMHRLANELVSQGRFSQALEYYDTIISRIPDYACFWNQKGIALEGLNRTSEALACYEKAIQTDPYHAEAWFNRGLALRQAGREQESNKCQRIASCLEQGREIDTFVSAQPSVAVSG